MIKIDKSSLGFESQKLRNKFSFKGNSITELWQTSVLLDSGENQTVGIGTQSVLWSDSFIFSKYGEQKGNQLMLEISKRALELINGKSFLDPQEVFNEIFDELYTYAIKITNNKHLKKTFVLNALVPLDNAIWLMHAKNNGIHSFEYILKGERNEKLLNIPLITYNADLEEVESKLESGSGILKIKIGSNPGQKNNLNEMLEWDKNRIKEIHELAIKHSSPYTIDGKIRYYLDANGRYRDKEMLSEFLDFTDKIGALEQIEIFEEPFSEEYDGDISDMPITVAMDECAHSIKDVIERISLGYGAIALKPIAKTLSLSLKMLDLAVEKNIPCFCADLTVNPNLVEWNKNFAARLKPLKGMKIVAFESNGAQNYLNWEQMLTFNTYINEPVNGIYTLDKEFYDKSGGIFDMSNHYKEIAERGIAYEFI